MPQRALHAFLPLQIPERDLDSRLLLAARLAALGVTVAIGPRTDLLNRSRWVGGGAYLLSNATNKLFLGAVPPYDFRFAIMDEEAVSIPDEDLERMRLDPDVLQLVERYFAWGNREAEIVARCDPTAAEKILVTGNPRAELLSDDFRGFYEEDVRRIQDAVGRPYVLVNQSFGQLDPSLPMGAQHEHASWRSSMHIEMRRAAEHLARRLPDFAVVYRPHPAHESVRRIERDGTSRLVITNSGAVIPWLIGAEKLVQNSCTTAIEASLIGTKVVTFRPRPDVRWERAFANSVGVDAFDLDDLVSAVLDTGRASSAGTSVDRDRVRQEQGHSPSAMIAEHLRGLAEPIGSPRLRMGLFEGLRLAATVPRSKKWGDIRLRRQRLSLSRRLRRISEAAGVSAELRLNAPQPRVIEISSRQERPEF